eukprot:SAG11_NODE_13334_length_659_cov_1.916071_1_plen_96_part_00
MQSTAGVEPLLGASDPNWRESLSHSATAPVPWAVPSAGDQKATALPAAGPASAPPSKSQNRQARKRGRALLAVVVACLGAMNFGYALGFSSQSER